MHFLDHEAVMLAEDEIISKLLNFSISKNDIKSYTEPPTCPLCNKPKYNQHGSMQDLRRWSDDTNLESATAFESSRSCCNCKNEPESIARNESFRQKKKNTGIIDAVKGGRNQSTSVKDFIAHNKLLCHASRFKTNGQNEKMYHFIHLKNSGGYMEQYRFNKLDKIEQSCYQLDQSPFDKELFSTLSKSLSSLMTNMNTESQAPFSFGESVGHHIPNTLKIDTQKYQPSSSNLTYLSSFNIVDPLRNETTKPFDCCVKCGDTLKQSKLIGNIVQSTRQDTNLIVKATSHDKIEEKKTKKLVKRISDQRPKILAEKPLMDAQKTELESTCATELQPLCQQIPIRKSSSSEKNNNLKKEDWKGHPTSTKPKFAERPDRGSVERRKRNKINMNSSGKSLEYADIFNTYGEKYHLLKETT